MTKGDRWSSGIRAAAASAGRPQTELAMAAGIPWPQWQRRMYGSVPWTAEQVAAVAAQLGVTVDHLMTTQQPTEEST